MRGLWWCCACVVLHAGVSQTAGGMLAVVARLWRLRAPVADRLTQEGEDDQDRRLTSRVG